MKKIVILLLVIALLFSLAACGGGEDNAKVVKVAALESAYGTDVWKQVADAFTAETGIEVDLVTDKSLEDVIGAQMKGGNYPDVVHLALGRPAALPETLIKENALSDIMGALSTTIPGETKTPNDKIANGFTDSSVTNPYSDGKTYLAPMFYGPCGLFYNKTLLSDNSWTVPTTWDEMWELGEKAKAKDIALFTYPTPGYFDAFLYALLVGVGGQDFFDDVTNYAEGVWDTTDGKTVLNILDKLAQYTERTTPANANNDNFQKNQQLILDNKAIFCPNGTWLPGEMAEAPRADGFEWGMTAVPSVVGKGTSYTWFEQAWIPAEAAHKKNAELFMAYLYSDKAVEIFAAKGAMQPVLGIADKLEGDNKLFYSIYDQGAEAVVGGFATTDPVEGVTVGAFVFDPINSLVSGAMTIEQYKEGLVKMNDALRPALKK